MSDSTPRRPPAHPGDRRGPDAGDAAAFVAGWEQTSTLVALRELMDLGGQVGVSVAKRAEMSLSELNALELLSEHEHRPGQLARELGVTTAAASGIVDRLAARGHVQRLPDPYDGRRTRVVITPSGLEGVLGHLMPMFTVLAELDRSLSEADRAVVDRYLRGAIDAIRRLL